VPSLFKFNFIWTPAFWMGWSCCKSERMGG